MQPALDGWASTSERIRTTNGRLTECELMNRKGMGKRLITQLIMLATSLTLVGCVRYSPVRYAYWDAEVGRLCKVDGGITVYERVQLSPTEYQLMRGPGESVVVPLRTSSVSRTPYVMQEQMTELNPGNPAVTRLETRIVRLSDNKVVSRMVYYSRHGQDLVGSYGCKDVGLRLDLERQTFEIPQGSDR